MTPDSEFDYEIDVCCDNSRLVNEAAAGEFAELVRNVLTLQHIRSAVISVTVVDDERIHILNRTHLDHDFPTDVITFELDAFPAEDPADATDVQPTEETPRAGWVIEGEIVVSEDYAERSAREYEWSAFSELRLYVLHGLLHLCGFGDTTDEQRTEMRNAEARTARMLNLPEAPWRNAAEEMMPGKETPGAAPHSGDRS